MLGRIRKMVRYKKKILPGKKKHCCLCLNAVNANHYSIFKMP